MIEVKAGAWFIQSLTAFCLALSSLRFSLFCVSAVIDFSIAFKSRECKMLPDESLKGQVN
jgi:hypothetical protein